MKNGFRFWASVIVFLACLGAFLDLPIQSAHAQGEVSSLPQIKDDAHMAAYMVGKIDGHVKQVRTIAYFTLGLGVIALLLSGCLFVLRNTLTLGSAPNPVNEILSQWRGDHGLARLRRRQHQLARAIADLQDFAEQAMNNNKEMSALLGSIHQQMELLDKGLDAQERRSSS